jgi:hypothetical protein
MATYRAALVWLLRVFVALTLIVGAARVNEALLTNAELRERYRDNPVEAVAAQTDLVSMVGPLIALGALALFTLSCAEILVLAGRVNQNAGGRLSLYHGGLVWVWRFAAIVAVSVALYTCVKLWLLQQDYEQELEGIRMDTLWAALQVSSVFGGTALLSLTMAETIASLGRGATIRQ